MNMKNASLFALLFVVGLVNAKITTEKMIIKKMLQNELNKTSKDLLEMRKLEDKERDKLLRASGTETLTAGMYFKHAHRTLRNCQCWHSATENCNKEWDALKFYFFHLKETDEYQKEFKPIHQKVEYLEWKVNGFKSMLHFVENMSEKFGSDMQAVVAEVDSLETSFAYDNTGLGFFDWTDKSEIQKNRAKEDLYGVVENIQEKVPYKKVKVIEASMPTYQ